MKFISESEPCVALEVSPLSESDECISFFISEYSDYMTKSVEISKDDIRRLIKFRCSIFTSLIISDHSF